MDPQKTSKDNAEISYDGILNTRETVERRQDVQVTWRAERVLQVPADSDRQCRLQTPQYLHNSATADMFHDHNRHAAGRKPYPVHRQRTADTCRQHVLLDHVHFHDARCFRERGKSFTPQYIYIAIGAALLLTRSMIITATQLVGSPIKCIVSGLPTHVVNTFCWITSTFTMPDAFARE
ncbi:Innexin, partial [Operophtera brumata]